MLPLVIHIERRREKVLKELWGRLKPTKGHTDTIYKLEFGPRLIKHNMQILLLAIHIERLREKVLKEY